MRPLFITGTDTGAGKTTVTRALAAALTDQGRRVAALKPIETGCALGPDGELVPEDATRLRSAAGGWLTLPEVVHLRFPAPLSPAAAAREIGQRIDIATLVRWIETQAARADRCLVEGAGGLLVPLDDQTLTADLVARLGADLLIVARDALGTVNHTLLTIAEAGRRGIAVRGIVLSRGGAPGPDAASNAADIARHGKVPMLGTLPYLPGASDAELGAAAGYTLAMGRLFPD